MPVKKKTKRKKTSKKASAHTCAHWSDMCLGRNARKLMWTLLGITLVYVIFYLGVSIRTQMEQFSYIGLAEQEPHTINLSAEGEVQVVPDLATTRMGVTTEADTVEEAQEANSAQMNTLLEALKAQGIAEKDLQTQDYNIFPRYVFPEDGSEREITGYTVSQEVLVKIRDVAKADEVLAVAGQSGATNVGRWQFSIDDTSVYEARAREAAVKTLKEKAKTVADLMGVDIVGIVSYDEFAGGNNFYPEVYAMRADEALESAPKIEAGEETVTMRVNVVFEIK